MLEQEFRRMLQNHMMAHEKLQDLGTPFTHDLSNWLALGPCVKEQAFLQYFQSSQVDERWNEN